MGSFPVKRIATKIDTHNRRYKKNLLFQKNKYEDPNNPQRKRTTA